MVEGFFMGDKREIFALIERESENESKFSKFSPGHVIFHKHSAPYPTKYSACDAKRISSIHDW